MFHAGGDGKSNGVGIIVSEKISKDVVREEIWQGRIIVAWVMVNKQLVCITLEEIGDTEHRNIT